MKTKRYYVAISFLVVGLLLSVKQGQACTDIVVGKKASVDGSVIISHTDCGQDCRIRVVKGQKYKLGEKTPIYYGIQRADLPLNEHGDILGYLPQVEETYTYFHSAYSHMNVHQLAIAESTMSQREELINNRKNGKQIMTIEQVQIFALQRCKKAKDAVELIGGLLTKYGFLPSSGDGSEVLCVGDTEEAWIFEVFGVGQGWTPESGKPGAIWAAQRVPDDHVTMIPNWSIIKEIDAEDTDIFLVSKNYMQEAIDRGWYSPDSGRPFVWQDAYAPMPREWATGRFWSFFSTVAPNYYNWPDRWVKEGDHFKGTNQYVQYVEPLSIYPFSVKPEKKMSVHDVIAFQRSVNEGTIYDKTLGKEWIVPNEEGGYHKSPMTTPFPNKELRKLLNVTYRRNVARGHGDYGSVCQLRSWLPDEIGGLYWVFLDNAYVSPYVPIYAGTTEIAECYKTYHPKEYSDKSARWTIDFVDNLLNIRYQDAYKDLLEVRQPFEDRIFGDQEKIEEQALKLYKKSPEKAKAFLTEYTKKNMNEVPEMFIKLREKMLVKYTNNLE